MASVCEMAARLPALRSIALIDAYDNPFTTEAKVAANAVEMVKALLAFRGKGHVKITYKNAA